MGIHVRVYMRMITHARDKTMKTEARGMNLKESKEEHRGGLRETAREE